MDRFSTMIPLRSYEGTVHLVLQAQVSAMIRVLEAADPARVRPEAPPELDIFIAARKRHADAVARTLGGQR